VPADLILYILVAAGLVFWLKSILGTTDDEEDAIREDKAKETEQIFSSQKRAAEQQRQEKLNALSGMPAALPGNVRFDNKTAENAVEDFMASNQSFDFGHFTAGAEQAFPMIVEGFAQGDKELLEPLLAHDVYAAFAAEIDRREAAGEQVRTEVQEIERMDILEFNVRDGRIFIMVRFTARELCVIRDAQGRLLSGDPDRPTTLADIWVFARDMDAEGPEWQLVQTLDEEAEDHKTPMPEAGSVTV
jgi:predicted lipid-binding transport protein (Tim44 family)